MNIWTTGTSTVAELFSRQDPMTATTPPAMSAWSRQMRTSREIVRLGRDGGGEEVHYSGRSTSPVFSAQRHRKSYTIHTGTPVGVWVDREMCADNRKWEVDFEGSSIVKTVTIDCASTRSCIPDEACRGVPGVLNNSDSAMALCCYECNSMWRMQWCDGFIRMYKLTHIGKAAEDGYYEKVSSIMAFSIYDRSTRLFHYSGDSQVAVIHGAKQEIADNTCVFFRERQDGEDDYLFIQSPEKGSACSTYMGRVGGRSILNLHVDGCIYHYIVMHELLHALGLDHEQSYPDREIYLHMLFANIADSTTID